MASASSDISSGSALVDTFVKRRSSSRSPREYFRIRSVSKTASQFISRNLLSFKLDDETVEEVETFRDDSMKNYRKVAILSEAEVQILEMLSTRLLALDNKNKIEEMERRLVGIEFSNESVPEAEEEALLNMYGKNRKRSRTERTERTGPSRFPKRDAKRGKRLLKL